ncbi:hypothetical protein VR7878_02684 [Vibrio ruber DSM 16370]|uniref:Uncharacterized protein n=1 Tax=Vibrio ruber (strain DSM 16370 / JCM 11486 / BCRC 17186 / CECT 7878 / LMG 23124 / VR1) TaxID=1123498 RepID=A0A1R4LNI5_VIBR1|nr:hypothetical protein [Vibrio ruber]SJN58161.1 hypothetical protein VR7878_02684 [Vibrio ruber DSM 16370]
MVDYFRLIGEKYESLLQRADFLSLISGNVPSKIDGYNEEFFICSDIAGLEIQFDTKSQTVTSIFITDPAKLTGNLQGVTDKSSVRQQFGIPNESSEEKKIPVLGAVGAWDKYFWDDNELQIRYVPGSDLIHTVCYLKHDNT